VLSAKRLVAAAKFLVETTKDSFVVPNFVAVTKPFFSVWYPGMGDHNLLRAFKKMMSLFSRAFLFQRRWVLDMR